MRKLAGMTALIDAPEVADTLTLEDGRIVELDHDGAVIVWCKRCAGTGEHMYNPLDGTVCYGCWGHPYMGTESVSEAQRRAHNRKLARDRKARKEQAARDAQAAERAAWLDSLTDAQRATVARLIAEHGTPAGEVVSGFMEEIAGKAQLRALTDKQLAAVERVFAQRDADAAAKCEAPTGRVEVTGRVVKVRVDLDTYSYTERYVHKMVVKCDGFAVWCSVPAAILDALPYDVGARYDYPLNTQAADLLRGRRVRFTATLTRSDNDASFAFGKRPTKAVLLDDDAAQ